MTAKASQILRAALALFGPNGEHWVNHMPRELLEQCSSTAISMACANDTGDYWRAASLLRGIRCSSALSVEAWNDESTWPEVKAGFEKAIALAEQREAAAVSGQQSALSTNPSRDEQSGAES